MSGGDSTVIDRINGAMMTLAVKAPVAAVTNAPITLFGAQMVNGTPVTATAPPMRVLVNNQSDPTTNGVYDVSNIAWSRSVDFDGAYDAAQGTLVLVASSANPGLLWQLTTANPIVFGTSAISFSPYLPTVPQIPFLTPEMFGARGDGVTDDHTAFQTCLTSAAASGAIVICLTKTYKINSQLSFDVSKTSITSYGATLDFSAIGINTSAFLLTTSSVDANTMIGVIGMHPVSNLYVIGPNNNNTLVANPSDAFRFQATTIGGIKFIPGTRFVGVAATGFSSMFNLSDGTFINTFENCAYMGTASISCGHMFRTTTSSNAGERYVIINPLVDSCDGFILDQAQNLNAEFYVSNPSVDASNRILSGGTPASPNSVAAQCRMVIHKGHYEGPTNSYLINAGSTASIIVNAMQFVFASPIAHTLFSCASTGTNGGIVLKDCQIIDATLGGIPSEFMCDGSGRFVVSGNIGIGGSSVPMTSVASNQIPLFNLPSSASFTDNWATTGTVTYDNTTAPAGATGSFKLVGNGASAVFDVPCSANQIASFQASIKTTGITAAGATLTMLANYRSVGGDDLGTASNIFSADIAAFSLNRVSITAFAPPGTAKVHVGFSLVSGGGAPIAWIGRPCAVAQ